MSTAKSYIFINSGNSATDPSQFSVNIPEDSIKVAKEGRQKLRLTLLQHSMINSIPNIQPKHNTVYLTFDYGASVPTTNLGFTSTASSEQVGYENAKAFNINTNDAWRCAAGLYNSSGAYTGSQVTSHNGINYTGERLELTLNSAIVPASYFIPGDFQGAPKSWALFGHDIATGATALLHEQTVSTRRSGTYNITAPAGTTYKYFWLVVRSIFNSTESSGACSISTMFIRTVANAALEYVIPTGTYTVAELVTALNSFGAPIAVTHDAKTNRLAIRNQSVDTLSISFQGYLGTITGFGKGNTQLDTDPVAGAKPIVPCVVNDLVLQLYEMSSNPPNNLSNIANTDLQFSTVFGIIPLRAPPRALNVYNNLTNAYQLDLLDTDPQRIGFRVTDVYGQLISNLPDWSAIIQVEIIDEEEKNPIIESLQGIMEYLRLIFVTKALSKSQRVAQNV